MPNTELRGLPLHEARWWEPEPGGRVHCTLCPRHCHIGPGQHGYCLVRANRGGVLYGLAWGDAQALQSDPIEKKPFHHFLPGTSTFSLGTWGCSLGCSFCQNWHLSRSRGHGPPRARLTPDDVVALALVHGAPSIALTYNEPIVWAEYGVEICRAARARGLRTVMVTNGYVTREAFHDVFDLVDAVNVDLKSFSEGFYSRVTLGHLAPVLETLRRLRRETGAWLEVTHLVIPALNDDPAETRALATWMVEQLGTNVPLHLSAFRPEYRMWDRPPTPPETLRAARLVARGAGLEYVYEGNVLGDGANTWCPGCGALLVRRAWHEVLENRLAGGSCPQCGRHVPGRWSAGEGAARAASPGLTRV